MNSTQNEDELRDIIGCACSFSGTYDGKSWNLKTEQYEPCICMEKLAALQALIAKAERAKMVELRDQWGVWLDDSADDKQTIREIYDWLNREIDFFDKERHTPEGPEAAA